MVNTKILTVDKKCYDTKLFGGVYFYDYWNLNNHPIYLNLNKRKLPYLKFSEIPTGNFYRVNSLTDINDFLRRNDWAFEDKYWKNISHVIVSFLNIPYT